MNSAKPASRHGARLRAQAWRRHRQTRLGTVSEQKKRRRRKRYQLQFHEENSNPKIVLNFTFDYKSNFKRIFLHVCLRDFVGKLCLSSTHAVVFDKFAVVAFLSNLSNLVFCSVNTDSVFECLIFC